MTDWGSVADWVVAIGTLIVAIVAVFQESIRGLFHYPKLWITADTKPPHCVSVPITNAFGYPIAVRICLRIWIENT